MSGAMRGAFDLQAEKLKGDAETLPGRIQSKKNHHKESKGNPLKKYPVSDDRMAAAFRWYRYISLLLTSVFFLLAPTAIEPPLKAGVVCGLAVFTVLVLQGYKHYRNNAIFVGLLILLETMAVALLLVFSGGFESPFIWYALNPLIVASAYLPTYYGWVFLSIFFLWAIAGNILLEGNAASIGFIIKDHSDIILIMLLLTLVVQIFTWLYSVLRDQSQQLKVQQGELISAFHNLSQNNFMLQALSTFQKDIVSYKNEEDIFLSLLKVCESVFPFADTAVLLFNEPRPPHLLTTGQEARVICQIDRARCHNPHAFKEIKERWQEFSAAKELVAADKSWLALPVWSAKKSMLAVFVGWIKPGAARGDFSEAVPFFISFCEQVIQGLRSLKQTEKNLEHISSLYEAVETISSSDNPREVVNLFAAYARVLTGCDKIIFWLDKVYNKAAGEKQEPIYTVKGRSGFFPEQQWQPLLLKAWSEISNYPHPVIYDVEDTIRRLPGHLLCVPVESGSRCFGMLAALQSQNRHNTEDIIQTLSFLAKLSAVSIERNISEQFADRLLVIEEQNRIANEMHDSISQNLFSIVYGLDVMVKKLGALQPEHRQTLTTIRDVASKTAKELRLLIYRLSPRHRGDDTFVREIKTYLDGLAHLNNIAVDLQVTGAEEYLNLAIRKAFYRIVKEATGNAVRHGKCAVINIEMTMNPFAAELKIADNGKGFDVSQYHDTVNNKGKLGLVNMKELAYSLQGTFKIDSTVGKGTTVNCTVPTAPVPRSATL